MGLSNIGAYIIANIMVRVPGYNYSILGPKTLAGDCKAVNAGVWHETKSEIARVPQTLNPKPERGLGTNRSARTTSAAKGKPT